MTDPVRHTLFRRLDKAKARQDTRVIPGRVAEISDDASRVKVRFSDQLEPAWVRADGVTAINAQVAVTVGTDGRPIAGAVTGALPNGADPEHVGPTGKRILGQQLQIDQTIQELAQARERLDEMDVEIGEARKYLPVSEDAPTVADEDDYPVGAIWQQTETIEGQTVVVGRWVLTVDGWTPIEDGGGVIHGETVAAAVGVFIDAMMEHLTVTGAANISEAAIGELTVRIAEILRLAVEQLEVGQDIRFTSSGLVFYAPVAEGQDPTDWENRIPIIALTPQGDTSVAVAKDGAITAGMTPDGDVWGHAGRFDTLELGGVDVTDLVTRDGPRGIISAVKLTSNSTITTTWAQHMGHRVELHTGRAYKITWMGKLSSDSGVTTQWMPRTRWGMTTVDLPLTASFTSDGVTHSAVFMASELGYPDGESVEVIVLARTLTSTASVNADSWTVLEDIGPEIEWQTVAGQSGGNSGTVPPVTWYGPSTFAATSAVGVRPNNTNAIDTRLTVGGYNIYGSDMAEAIWFPINFSRLNDATVRSATLRLTVTQSAYSSQGTAIAVYAGTSAQRVSGGTNIYNGTVLPGGQRALAIPAAVQQALVGKAGISVRPFYPGSLASYGYLSATLSLSIIYTK